MLERFLTGGEQRAITFQSVWAAGGDFGASSWSGSRINYDTAFMLSTTFGCVSLITDTIATFPADTFVRRDGERLPYSPRPVWVDEPDTGLTWSDHAQQVLISMLLSHGACTRVYRNTSGEVVSLVSLDPQLVEPQRNSLGEIEYVWNSQTVISARDMIYIPRLRKPGAVKGIDPLDELKQTFGAASALDEFAARFFSNGSTTSGVLELPQTVSREQAAQLKEIFEDGHRGNSKAHRVGVLGGGGKFVKTSVDPNEAQMLESRRFMVEEIARVFRVPLHMLQVAAPGVQSFASNEENALQFASYTLRPLVARIENAYSRLIPGGGFLRLNMDAILRGDLATRYSAYATAIQSGFLNINTIHRLEDMPSVPGGDAYRVPLANVNLSAADLVETDKKISMAQKLVWAGFDPADVLAQLGLPAIKHTGLPSAQLQPISQIDPESPTTAYPVEG